MIYYCCIFVACSLGCAAFVPPLARNKIEVRQQQSTILSSLYSKWDNLVDDEEEEQIASFMTKVPPDMCYDLRNVERQHQQFLDIRAAGGTEVTNDVYIRQPDTDIYWFVGKVARVDGVTPEECLGRQYPLIAQYAANLRPFELYLHRDTNFEFYLAPGDSEMLVANNEPNLKFTKIKFDDIDDELAFMKIKMTLVGFQGEEYEKGEEGFRTWRNEDGYASRPEIQSPTERETPPKEMN
mmetsp:Transcript_23800/g.27090  ORF Transcript_23800/g.27090 Transcript_23800/m.27090 type:complete len:239 (-) Transcript_23800:293-1009(-)